MGMEADIKRAGHILSTTSDWSRDISGSHFMPLISLNDAQRKIKGGPDFPKIILLT